LIVDQTDELDARARGKAPIFFIHSPRSGSVMLRGIIDAHPRINCPHMSPLLNLFLDAANSHPWSAAAYRSLRAPRGWTMNALRGWIESISGEIAQQAAKPRWIYRYWGTYRSLHFIDELFDGQALYIFLVRHGLDVADAASKVYPSAETWQVGPNGRAEHFIEACGGSFQLAYAHFWREISERMLEFGAMHPKRVHLIRYEDLVARPKETLSALFGFMGEDYPDGLVERFFQGPRTVMAAIEGHESLRTKGIEAGRHGMYRLWNPGLLRSAAAVVNDALAGWGYDRVSTEVESPPAENVIPRTAPPTGPRQFSLRELPMKQAPLNPNPLPDTSATG
jgi:hypothetical protein